MVAQLIFGSNFISYRLDSTVTVCMITASDKIWLKRVRSLTLSAHAWEGYSSHFVCQSVCVTDFGEGTAFRVETYSTF